METFGKNIIVKNSLVGSLNKGSNLQKSVTLFQKVDWLKLTNLCMIQKSVIIDLMSSLSINLV